MNQKSKNAIFYALLILGLLFWCIGIFYLSTAFQNNSESTETVHRYIPIIRNASAVTSTYNIGDEINPINVRILITFKTLDVFSIDNKINYTTEAVVSDINKTKRIIVILSTPNNDFSYVNMSNFDTFLDDRKQWYNDVVELTPNVNASYFLKDANITFHTEGNIVLYTLIMGNDFVTQLPPTESLLAINSPIAKLQADTDRDILKLNDDIRKQTKEQNQSDNITMALTFVVAGWVPVDIAFRLRKI